MVPVPKEARFILPEIKIGVERRVDRIGCDGGKQRVTVGRRVGNRLGREVGGGAWSVLYDKWLAKPL